MNSTMSQPDDEYRSKIAPSLNEDQLADLEARILNKAAQRLSLGMQAAVSDTEEYESALELSNGKSSGPDFLELIQVAASLLVILGAGLYAAIRFGQQVFYNQLGVRPEEVGLTYAATVSRAAVVIVALLSAVAFYCACAAVWIKIANILWEKNWIAKVTAAAISGLLGVGLVRAIIYLAQLLGSRVGLFMAVVAIILGISTTMWDSISAALRWIRNKFVSGGERTKPETDKQDRKRRDNSLQRSSAVPIIGVVVISCLSFGALILSGVTATKTAEAVQQGYRISPSSGFGILGLRAEPSLVVGDLAEDLGLSKRSIMYLGQAEGTVVLFDVGRQRTIRVPADGVALFPGYQVVENIRLSPNQGLDLDRPLENGSGILPIERIDPGGIDFSWRKEKILTGSALDSQSAVRASIVDVDMAPDRTACTKLTASIKQLRFPKDIQRGLGICIHTNEGRWVLLTVKDFRKSPEGIELKVLTWPA